MKITKFEEIKSWQEAKILVGFIYKASRENRFRVDYALAEQIRRAGISVMANIAEGFDCSSNIEFAKFLSYSQRSCSEIQSHLYIALEQKYIDDAQFEEMYQKCSQVKNLIGGFIKYIKNSRRIS